MADTTQSSKSLPIAGKLTATTTAQPLAPTLESYRPVREIIVQAHPANTDNVDIGNPTTMALTLEPGASIAIPIENPHEVWAKAISGSQVVGFLGRD